MSNAEYVKCIRKNYVQEYEDYSSQKVLIALLASMMPGHYKLSKKTVLIPIKQLDDHGTLVAELLHGKSFLQNDFSIKPWFREGFTHYLAKIMCCGSDLNYKGSERKLYFPLWEEVHKRIGFRCLLYLFFNPSRKAIEELLSGILEINIEKLLECKFESICNILNLKIYDKKSI